MANPELDRKTKVDVEDASSLKGTLTSVLLLGGFLVLSWIGVFIVFINRF
ncbi:cytochrome c oxidase subunit 2A [Rossellomorea aquimaris]|nr:cytochrome c oxidase subunit 2A [Rossellomorea aquimaris]MCA1054583.1 cytochrome c oxidase subunit 2A [Rossellomorea aquimaris]